MTVAETDRYMRLFSKDTSLGARSAGRDNNLNLIRMLAACAVLVSHAYPIALGAGASEPLEAVAGKSLGGLAVMVFFAISGFLIAASFDRTPSRLRFLKARALRLFPGLVVSLVLTAYVLGPLVTRLPVPAYLGLPEPALFVLRDTALFPLVFTLPGVFDDNPYPAVTGSIWTLRHEGLCYAGVFLTGLAGWLRPDWRGGVLLLVYLLLWGLVRSGVLPVHVMILRLFDLSLAFAIGTAFHLWRDRLPLSLPGVAALAVLAAALRPVGGLAYDAALAAALSYATFWAAYVPRGVLLRYNGLGDYSYGIYIYAFPLQGWAVWAFGPQTPLQNMLYAFPVTLICAILSWHLIERPALRMKASFRPARMFRGRRSGSSS